MMAVMTSELASSVIVWRVETRRYLQPPLPPRSVALRSAEGSPRCINHAGCVAAHRTAHGTRLLDPARSGRARCPAHVDALPTTYYSESVQGTGGRLPPRSTGRGYPAVG